MMCYVGDDYGDVEENNDDCGDHFQNGVLFPGYVNSYLHVDFSSLEECSPGNFLVESIRHRERQFCISKSLKNINQQMYLEK